MPVRTMDAPAMSGQRPTRRAFLARAAMTASIASSAGACHRERPPRGRDRGVAAAPAPAALKRLDPRIVVTLVEPSAIFTAANSATRSSPVARSSDQNSPTKAAGSGVELARLMATGVDPQARA